MDRMHSVSALANGERGLLLVADVAGTNNFVGFVLDGVHLSNAIDRAPLRGQLLKFANSASGAHTSADRAR